jgi:hypothetical protein
VSEKSIEELMDEASKVLDTNFTMYCELQGQILSRFSAIEQERDELKRQLAEANKAVEAMEKICRLWTDWHYDHSITASDYTVALNNTIADYNDYLQSKEAGK